MKAMAFPRLLAILGLFAATGEEYAAFMKNGIGRWSPIVKAAGIKIE